MRICNCPATNLEGFAPDISSLFPPFSTWANGVGAPRQPEDTVCKDADFRV
jgi:hypothetical protein